MTPGSKVAECRQIRFIGAIVVKNAQLSARFGFL